MTKRLVFIAGPTASGKSAAALKLAVRCGGVIINADSMQIYRDLSIISARPTADEEAQAPHRLYGHIDADTDYNAAQWAKDAFVETKQAWDAGKLPIIVGGTGLYFRTIIEGVAEIPEIPAEIRKDVRAQMTEVGPEAMHMVLNGCDPVMAGRLAPRDQQRISRALEVFYATKQSLASWQQNTPHGPLYDIQKSGQAVSIVLNWPRDILYERCNVRFDRMIEAGGLDEVKALVNRGLSPDRPALKALGAPSLVAYLRGEIDFETACKDAKMRTRRFAKRQMTWFRNQLTDWIQLDANDMENNIINIEKKIQKQR